MPRMYDSREHRHRRERCTKRADAANPFIRSAGDAIPADLMRDSGARRVCCSPRGHYVAAESYIRGIERRVAAGLNPHVGSVASVFVSRWDSAVASKAPAELNGRLGIAMAKRTYKAYRDLLASDRCSAC